MRSTVIRGLVLTASSGALCACSMFTSAEQGRALEERNRTLEARVVALETGLGEEIRTQVAESQTKVAQLEEVLQRATQVVTRASADTGAQVEQLQQQIATQEGAIAELRNELERMQRELREQQGDYENRMKKLARRAGVDIPLEDAEVPADREAHWTAALAAVEARDLSRARALFRAFVERHRDDQRADDAQYRLGQTYMSEDRPATALGELRHVITDFPQGDAVPAALLAMGDAFYRLHACTNARTSLDTLIRTYPRATQVAEARTKLRDIQRAPSGYCTE